MIRKIQTIYNCFLLFLCSCILAIGLYVLIKILIKSETVIGGFISYFSIVYKYLCVCSFFIIHHGLVIYIIGLFLVLICGAIMRKIPIKELLIFSIIIGIWFGIYFCYNMFVVNTLVNVNADDINNIKLTVVALNDEPAVVILNLVSVLNSVVFVAINLRIIQKVINYFCIEDKKGEDYEKAYYSEHDSSN